MKTSIISVLVLFAVISVRAHAETDLEIDDQFFHSAKSPYEDDELDRATRKDPLAQKNKQQHQEESAVKNEFNSAQPGLMKSYEAQAMDQAVIRENKRREKAILKKLAENAPAVRACVDQAKQNFQGTHITMGWLISADGKVLQAAVRSTDIQNPEIEKCIYDSSLKIDFAEAATTHLKQSMAQYTYKIKVRSRAPASVKRVVRKAKKAVKKSLRK